VGRGQLRAVEHLVDIGRDRARLIEREIAVLKDRHPVKRVQREMRRCPHLWFEIAEDVRHCFVLEHQPRDVDKGTARKSIYGDRWHWVLQAATETGTRSRNGIPPQALGPTSGAKIAVLGRMPWGDRATA